MQNWEALARARIDKDQDEYLRLMQDRAAFCGPPTKDLLEDMAEKIMEGNPGNLVQTCIALEKFLRDYDYIRKVWMEKERTSECPTT